MAKIDVAGLKIDALTKAELLQAIAARLAGRGQTFITTPYSEFLYHILWSPNSLKMLNQADFAVADGIAVLWAAYYFSLPLTAKNYWLKILQAFWQASYTLFLLAFRPNRIKSIVPEKIVGAELVWDLCGLAEKQNLSVYLLGGFGQTPGKAAKALSVRFPRLAIAGFSSKNPDDATAIQDIAAAKPDMLFVAFGPLRQEEWIVKHLKNLPVKLAIGLGGTFDYLAGTKPLPPPAVRRSGWEWLWRLFTQKGRGKRIWQATWGTVKLCLNKKVASTLPYRKNVVSIILNQADKIFIGRFNPNHPIKSVFLKSGGINYQNRWQFPQGGIEPGESPAVAARRETFEETGIKSLEFLMESKEKFSYNWPADHTLATSPRYRYRGQTQNLVYFRFTGGEEEISLDQNEFVDYRWVAPEELGQALHEDKLALANIVRNDLKYLAEKAIL